MSTHFIVVGRILVALAAGVVAPVSVGAAADGTAEIRFRAGEFELIPYLEMASESLGLQVNATAVDASKGSKVVVSPAVPMDRAQAMTRLHSALAQRGYALVHDADIDLYRVLPVRDARDENIPFVTDAAELGDDDRYVTYALPLRHIPAEEMARTLRSFAPANSRIISDATTNGLLITDASRAMGKYVAIAARFDTPKAAEEMKAQRRSRHASDACPPRGGEPWERPAILIALFSAVALLLGFIARGYVIRRIEGGL